MVSMFHTSLVIHGRCKIFLFQHGQTSSSSAMKLEVRLIKPFQRKTQNTVKHSVKKKHFPSPCQNEGLGKRRWKICDVHFVHGSPVDYDILYLSTKTETCMKPQFQWEKCWTHFWPSMEDVNLSFFCTDKLRVYPRRHWYFHWWNTFKGRQKNTVKHSIKSTFSISIQLNCNWLPGNPQLPPNIYIYTHIVHGGNKPTSITGAPPCRNRRQGQGQAPGAAAWKLQGVASSS